MKPILFNTEMVRAILDGRKTQTRRVIKSKYLDSNSIEFIGKNSIQGNILRYKFLDSIIEEFETSFVFSNSKLKIGDILYVRETWTRCFLNNKPMIVFKADENIQWKHENDGFKISWIPSIHMPKEAARIFLKVTNVRVERLKDISEDDAKKEGVKAKYLGHNDYDGDNYANKYAFMELWNSTAKEGYKWEDNPCVFVYEFEKVEKPCYGVANDTK